MIGLIDIDGKIPNLALMKISTHYKSQGEQVEFVKQNEKYSKIYASSVFEKSKHISEQLKQHYGDLIEIGGTGWDKTKRLPAQIEQSKADYNLYTSDLILKKIGGILRKEKKLSKAIEIVNAGMGFTSRGCVRNCGFCFVPTTEGQFRQDQEINDIINPKSNIIILHDNNLTADPNCIDKLHEIRDRKLVVDINQGCDVRLMTPDIAKALSEVKHLRSIHFAWDLMGYEKQVLNGIKILGEFIKPYRQMCFVLVGFNTTFEEDLYRFRKLVDMKIDPYIMVYNDKPDTLLRHFARWVNSRIYKSCTFEEYEPWVKANHQIKFEL